MLAPCKLLSLFLKIVTITCTIKKKIYLSFKKIVVEISLMFSFEVDVDPVPESLCNIVCSFHSLSSYGLIFFKFSSLYDR